jgi:hypothetical protein
MRPLFFCLLLALRRVAADDDEDSDNFDSNPGCKLKGVLVLDRWLNNQATQM